MSARCAAISAGDQPAALPASVRTAWAIASGASVMLGYRVCRPLRFSSADRAVCADRLGHANPLLLDAVEDAGEREDDGGGVENCVQGDCGEVQVAVALRQGRTAPAPSPAVAD